MLSRILNNKGLSMVELMIVLVVLAIGIIPIAAVQTQSSRDVFKSGQRTEALSIAHEQMERAKNLGFNAAVSDSGFAGSTGQFAWRTIVQPRSLGLNAVTVTVQWREQGRARQVQITNLLSMR